VDTRDRHVNTVAVTLTVYKQHPPYSGTDFCTSIIFPSVTVACVTTVILKIPFWNGMLCLGNQILSFQGNVGSYTTLPSHVRIQLPMEAASYISNTESSATPLQKH
jgi:hypothetical protein